MILYEIKLPSRPIIIGISGSSASGKSLFASTLVSELGKRQIPVIREDSYYKDQSHIKFQDREKTNYDHPDAFDHSLLKEHIKLLQERKEVDVPVYNYGSHTRENYTVKVGKNNIFIIEGILLFSDEVLRNLMDIKIFIDTALDLCIIRRIQRDVMERERSLKSIIEQYNNTVRPMFYKFIEPSKKYADLIVPGGGKNMVAIDVIKAKIRELINDVEH